jgi:hypothetical protein
MTLWDLFSGDAGQISSQKVATIETGIEVIIPKGHMGFGEGASEDDYKYWKNIFETNCKDMGDYHDLYLCFATCNSFQKLQEYWN